MYIEGLGDEVTIFLGIVVAFLVILIGWWSTEVNRLNTHTVITITRFTPVVPANRQAVTVSDAPTQTVNSATVASTESTDSTTENVPNVNVPENASNNEEMLREASTPANEQAEAESESSNDSSAETIDVRLKFLDDTHRSVKAKLTQTLTDFKNAHFAQDLRENKIVRLISNGRVLREANATLRELGFVNDCVIHCLIHRDRSAENPDLARQSVPNFSDRPQDGIGSGSPLRATNGPVNTLDVGFLLFPMLGSGLGILWYCRCFHAMYFSAATTLALLGLSGLFVAALCANYPTRQAN